MIMPHRIVKPAWNIYNRASQHLAILNILRLFKFTTT